MFLVGITFFEEKDMKKLSEYAKEGWILERFAGIGYKLEEKGNAEALSISTGLSKRSR